VLTGKSIQALSPALRVGGAVGPEKSAHRLGPEGTSELVLGSRLLEADAEGATDPGAFAELVLGDEAEPATLDDGGAPGGAAGAW
jgi:hypothetical protein